LNPIKLNAPELDKGQPVMQALQNRKSQREFSDRALSMQHLSELLWAANGVNREDGRRTAPSAMNKHLIDVYVMLQEGVYLYEPEKRQLTPLVEGDSRPLAGMQDFVATAPVNLIYVAGFDRLKDLPFPMDENTKLSLASLDAGHNAENVYLYCASEGLAVVVRGAVDRERLGNAIKLGPEQKVVLTQTVGYPK
jgi:SagB-type dehydrogenase family enzyme